MPVSSAGVPNSLTVPLMAPEASACLTPIAAAAAGGAEDAVTAAVPGHHLRPGLALGGGILRQAGQRIEFREDADHRPAGAVRRDKRGRHAGHAGSRS